MSQSDAKLVEEITKYWILHSVTKPDPVVVMAYVQSLKEAGFGDHRLVHDAILALDKAKPQQYPHSCSMLLDVCRAMAKSWRPPGQPSMLALPAHEDGPAPRAEDDPFERLAKFWEACPPRGRTECSNGLALIRELVGAEPGERPGIVDAIITPVF